MKKLIAIVCLLLTLFTVDTFARGSFSSSRSSFSSSRSSYTPSRSTTPSRGGLFTSTKKTYSGSSMGDLHTTHYVMPTNRQILSRSTTYVVASPYRSISVYHYYYPGYFYGSGYNFFQYYYWSHIFGDHSHCYHSGGGMAVPRKCDPNRKTTTSEWTDNTCTDAETCDVTTRQCKLKD